MIRILALLVALFAPTAAFAQANVIPNCYNGNNVFGATTYVPCPGNLPTTNRSVVIATGNTFQTVLAASVTGRNSLTIENNNATDSCWVYIGASGQTEAKAILLLAGAAYTRYFPFVPSDAIQATCATSSDTLYVDTQ